MTLWNGAGRGGYWGMASYGSSVTSSVQSSSQGYQPNAKPDTQLLTDYNIGHTVDLSQCGADLINSGAWFVTGDPAGTRFAAGTSTFPEREISFTMVINRNSTGTICRYGAMATASTYNVNDDQMFKVSLLNNGRMLFTDDGGAILSATLQNLGNDEQRYSVHWSSRLNRLSGSYALPVSAALKHDIVIYNHTSSSFTASWVVSAFSKPVPAAAAAYGFSLCSPGSNVNTFRASALKSFRFGNAYHTPVEFSEDWVGLRPWPNTVCRTERDPLMFNDTLGDQDRYFGPQLQLEGLFRSVSQRRLCSPFVNMVYPVRRRTSFTNIASSSYWHAAPDPDYYWSEAYLYAVEVPRGVLFNKIRWMANIGTEGAAAEKPINVRVYSANRMQFTNAAQNPGGNVGNLVAFYDQESLTSETLTTSTTDAGSWISGSLKPSIAPSDSIEREADVTYIYLAFNSSTPANRISVNAFSCWPALEPGTDVDPATGGESS